MAAESPLDQFRIHEMAPLGFGGTSVAFTNSTLWMVLVLGLIWLFMVGGMRRASLVPNRWQAAVEGVYGFIDSMAVGNIGPEGRRFMPLIFSLFMFILVANFASLFPTGIIPGAQPFAVTSHFSVTAILAIVAFSTVLIVGLARHGLHFFSLFVPSGVPWFMLIIIVPIEFVSFMIRPFSLALRLFVALTAGHLMLDLFGKFIVDLSHAHHYVGILAIPTFLLLLTISALELLVAAIQAYVFALLTTLYLNDAVNLH